MSLSLVTPPTLEPVTLAEARAQCRITDNSEDALVAGYLIAARDYVETHTRRALMLQTFDLKFDVLEGELILKRPPVSAVVSVKYIDSAGAEQTLAADQYQLIRRDSSEYVVVPAYGVTWPTPRDVEQAVTVRYTAGYGPLPSDVPEAIRLAILRLVHDFFAKRSTSDIPADVEALLFPHRAF